MPSSKIQRIVEDLHETLDIEVKNWLGGLVDKLDQAKLAREIIALGNHGGGYIFVGFSDDEGHPEIRPLNGEENAYSQDSISGIVERLIEPSCQVKVETVQLPGSSIAHPVLIVPGGHRTPLWAKKGAADEDVLKSGTIYVRRTGAKSESPRSQDDWEKLIDRYVKARQSDLITAMRVVLNPELAPVKVSTKDFEKWISDSHSKWQDYLENLSENDPRRFSKGYWAASFSIENFNVTSISDLNDFVRDEMPSGTGWKPFQYLYEDGRRPISLGNVIEAWLGYYNGSFTEELIPTRCGFWRISTDGRGYVVMPFIEDDPGYCQGRSPRPTLPCFDRVFHAYRVAELLRVIEVLGLGFSSGESDFRLKIIYSGMKDRNLESQDFNWAMGHEGISHENIIETEIAGSIDLISTNLEEMIASLLDTVYGYFDFGELIPAIAADAARHAKEQ